MKLSDRLNKLSDEAVGNLILLVTMITGCISTLIGLILAELNIFSLGEGVTGVTTVILVVLFVLLGAVILGIASTGGKFLSQKWLKFYLLAIMYIWLTINCSILYFHETMLLLLPLFISRCYNIPKINRFCAFTSITLIIATPYIAYSIGGMDVTFLEWYIETLDPSKRFPEFDTVWATHKFRDTPVYIQFLLWIVLPRFLISSCLIVISVLGNYAARKSNRRNIAEITNLQDSVIYSMSDIMENRDASTGGHVKRTQDGVRILVSHIRNEVDRPDKYWDDLIKSASLHDLGKISIADKILNKPGSLDKEEFDSIKTHPEKSKEIIDKVFEKINDTGLLEVAQNVALYHHEKYNGEGYPKGLSGEDIPLEARIMAIADVYDALVSERCYKKPYSFEEAYKIMKDSMGSHFDPLLWPFFDEAVPELEAYYSEIVNTTQQAEIH